MYLLISVVGVARFELAKTFPPPAERSGQAELHPEVFAGIVTSEQEVLRRMSQLAYQGIVTHSRQRVAI